MRSESGSPEFFPASQIPEADVMVGQVLVTKTLSPDGQSHLYCNIRGDMAYTEFLGLLLAGGIEIYKDAQDSW